MTTDLVFRSLTQGHKPHIPQGPLQWDFVVVSDMGGQIPMPQLRRWSCDVTGLPFHLFIPLGSRVTQLSLAHGQRIS